MIGHPLLKVNNKFDHSQPVVFSKDSKVKPRYVKEEIITHHP